MKNQKSSFELFKNLNIKEVYNNICRPIIIADNLRTPENMGSVLRLAANIGALKTLFVSEETPSFKSYKIKKTASGAAEKIYWKTISIKDLNNEIPKEYSLIAVETTSSAKDIYTFAFPIKTAFIIGNEKSGIREGLLQRAKTQLYIPLPGPLSSLNTSHALSIAVFEWYRQMTVKIS